MKYKKVYLCGKMGGLTFEEYNGWRKYVTEQLLGRIAYDIHLTCINPADYFNFEEQHHDNEMEIIKWELNHVKTSDVVIANLNNSKSTGSNIEIYTAWQEDIPVIALWDKEKYPQHPWVEQFLTRSFETWDELLDYVNYYHML